MNSTAINLSSWLHHLRFLMPPVGVVIAGAGSGSWTSLLAGMGVATAHFIEADEGLGEHLQTRLSAHEAWQAHTALLWREVAEVDFYQASNPAENGILPPESLAALWPNLKTQTHEQRPATTLNGLLNDIQPSSPPNWLIVDCLPSLAIVEGAGAWIESCEVIVARVLLDDALLPASGAGKAELDRYLATQGFRCIAIQEERQPLVGSALYVRDWNSGIQILTDTLARVDRLAVERQTQLDQMTQARDEKAKLAVQRKQQIEQLTLDRDEQGKLAAERQLQLDQMTQARDEKAKLAVQCKQQIEQLTQDRDEQGKRVEESEKQINALQQAQKQAADKVKADLEKSQLEDLAERSNWVKQKTELAKARNKADALATSRQAEIAALERRFQVLQASSAEAETRYGLLQNELIKAQAQIELIKELVLPEPGL